MSPRRRPAPGPTLATSIADDLRTRILSGDLEPGIALREEQIAASTGASRHTVRAALATLNAENLVESVPYRGSRVARLDDDAARALAEFRGALEAEAVRLLGSRDESSWTDALEPARAAVERVRSATTWAEAEAAHADVHLALVAAAGSPRITAAYAGLGAEMRLLLLHIRPHYDAESLADEHAAYLDDVVTRGTDAVHAHLARSTALVTRPREVNPPR
ncbi:GntR family transcriptional regulator [Agromyces atrinae]|uniref:GntR family transcriptional regulator n=1 Tax=Agromyces atrinae TaxID=592376 RepID=A0A4Q2M5W9_9MICO|nr:GntR family transcriptional regulator [Agromyces atrinae]NYD68428.1 DNA-binding GntR family transcriptional regulator [Agromyces atrinae]RXZ85172.1 GntR family transcriptional regulator [Agromyces atrinae]